MKILVNIDRKRKYPSCYTYIKGKDKNGIEHKKSMKVMFAKSCNIPMGDYAIIETKKDFLSLHIWEEKDSNENVIKEHVEHMLVVMDYELAQEMKPKDEKTNGQVKFDTDDLPFY